MKGTHSFGFFTKFLRKCQPIIYFSHCISSFGHSFRADYRKLGGIRQLIALVPILAVTATATEHVRDDIIKSLRLKNPQCVSMGFDRPNIHFSFRNKTKQTWDDLRPFVKNIRGSVIVYVLTKNGYVLTK